VKGITVLLMSILLCLSFWGCGKQTQPEPTQLPTTEPATEPTMPVEERVLRSLASEGNNSRLQRVIAKITAGGEVTVGFIGGSITEGYNARKGNNYAVLVTDYLDTTYSDGTGKVRCVNAGLSGTPSALGLVRAERDLLVHEPELIFIEFAVNDGGTFTDKQAYEGLIRKCLTQENEPAVVLLYSVTENGYSCQNEMAMTAFYYGLPAVSVRDAIMPEIEAGNMKWTDWSDDEVHPHTEGHALYSRFIAHLIDTLVRQEPDEAYQVPGTCRFSRDWSATVQYDRENLTVPEAGSFAPSRAHPHFPNSWSHDRSAGNEGMTFEVTGTALFLVYKATTAGSYGTAEILLDGEPVLHLNARTADGWNNPVTQLVFSEKETATHTVTIRMQEGDEDKCFDLLAIGVTEP